eukprot:m.421378 g.421378  ORF g.421378 m.421378 type:complete len:622 (+) comp16846_c4_seq4:65-1930(+)
MGDIDAAAALQEQLRQARHEEEKFKRREAELEAAYHEAEEKRREEEQQVLELQRKLREATRVAESARQQVEEAGTLSAQLEAAEAQLNDVKRTLSAKDQQLVMTQQELHEHQHVLELLEEEERVSTGAILQERTDVTSHETPEFDDETANMDSPSKMDPELLRSQQQEIARLRDLLDEESERRRLAETALVRGNGDSSDDDTHDRGGRYSLEDELAGASLADELSQVSSPKTLTPDTTSAEIERLEKEKALVQAELEAERARLLSEQTELRAAQERLQIDAAAREAARAAALNAKDAMERRLAEERDRIQGELDAERARFAAEQQRLRRMSVEFESSRRQPPPKQTTASASELVLRRRAIYAASRGLKPKTAVDLRTYIFKMIKGPRAVLDPEVNAVHGGIRLTDGECAGQLAKKGKNRHNWKSRWFLFDLRHRRIVYFENASLKKQVGSFNMNEVLHVVLASPESQKDEDVAKSKRKFMVVTPKRTWQLMGPTEESRNVWVGLFVSIIPEVSVVKTEVNVNANSSVKSATKQARSSGTQGNNVKIQECSAADSRAGAQRQAEADSREAPASIEPKKSNKRKDVSPGKGTQPQMDTLNPFSPSLPQSKAHSNNFNPFASPN